MTTVQKRYAFYLLSVVFTFSLLGCSGLEEHPAPSEAAAKVILSEDYQQFQHCQALNAVMGYGSFDTEARNDIRHQAAITHKANAVLLDNVETFYQNERIQNYLRTPIMKAPFGTNKYYYEDAFTLKATGTAYRCANGQAERSEG